MPRWGWWLAAWLLDHLNRDASESTWDKLFGTERYSNLALVAATGCSACAWLSPSTFGVTSIPPYMLLIMAIVLLIVTIIFFAMPMAPTLTPAPAADAAEMDDLMKYAALPAETNLDLDVLAWWKARDHDQPADPASGRSAGLPHLAKMAAHLPGSNSSDGAGQKALVPRKTKYVKKQITGF